MVHSKHFKVGAKASGPQSAPSLFAASYPYEKFAYRRGLKSSQIHQTIASNDGRIWCATAVGLGCYDGVSIDMFGLNGELAHHGLRTLAVDDNNSLWLGSDLGMEVMDISGAIPVSRSFDDVGTVVCLDINGKRAVFGGLEGLFKKQGNAPIQRFSDPLIANAHIASVFIHNNSDVWATGPHIGLVKVTLGGKVKLISDLPHEIGVPILLAAGPGESVLVGGDLGFAVLDKDGVVLSSTELDCLVTAFCTINQDIWVGANKTVVRYPIKSLILEPGEVVSNTLYANDFFEDEVGNIWISTDSNALCRISTLRHIFKGSSPASIGGGRCVVETPDGLIIGGNGGAILPNGTTTLQGLNTWDCVVGPLGKIWSATDQGLYCLVNPNFNIPYKHEKSGIFAAPCRCLAIYEDELYVGSIRGLARNTASGPEEIRMPGNKPLGYVYSLHESADGALLIATHGNGLWVLKNKKLTQIVSEELSVKDSVYCFANGANGEVYVGHDNKISRLSAKYKIIPFVTSEDVVAAWSLNSLPTGELIAGTSAGMIFYDTDTGEIIRRLLGTESDAPWEFTTSRSVLVSGANTIICGTSSGTHAVDYSAIARIESKPIPTCKTINWQNVTPETVNGEVRVSRGKWYLQIQLKTCWYIDESDCKMRVWLRGFDDDWSSFREVSDIFYTSLPAGHYALHVQLSSPIAGAGPVKEIFSFHVD